MANVKSLMKEVLNSLSPFVRLYYHCYGFITYLIKLVVPINLSVFYPYPIINNSNLPIQYYFYPLLFIWFVVSIIYSFRFSKKIIFGTSFFAITVFLVLQLLPIGDAIMADRYAYIPSIGVLYLAGEGFYWLWNKKYKIHAIVLLSIITLLFSVKTYERCSIWKNEMTLWNDVISQYQTAPLAYNNRGMIPIYE